MGHQAMVDVENLLAEDGEAGAAGEGVEGDGYGTFDGVLHAYHDILAGSRGYAVEDIGEAYVGNQGVVRAEALAEGGGSFLGIGSLWS